MEESVVSLDRAACLELHSALRREWLETDGCGGYASSTVLMCPTRRYHGLLIANLEGVGRHSFLSRFEETVHGADHELPLSMARYPSVWHPHGHRSMQSFELVPWPRSRYLLGRVDVTREIQMQRGAPVVLCRYLAEHPYEEGLRLRLRPILTCRPHDRLSFENLAVDTRVARLENGVAVRPYDALPALSITVSGVEAEFEVEFEADPVWYREVEYQRDLARGYDGHEDSFSPGWFDLPLTPGTEIVVAATIEEPVAAPVALWRELAERRRSAAAARSPGGRGLLELVADDFLYRGADRRLGVIAGYPWFGEWGRDTFIALPGLLLARDRLEQCGEALEGALSFLDGGRLPNIFEGSPSESAYNSVDSALWFARAVECWVEAGGGPKRRRQRLLRGIEHIADAFLGDDVPGVGVDHGLLSIEKGSGALTWMDAVVDGVPITPRDGCAVEINALWFALLRFLERSHRAAGAEAIARRWGRLRRATGESFLARFWLESRGQLADRWGRGEPDASIRPNMVIAAALEASPLSRDQRLAVVERAEAELVTPLGLRTLSPSSPEYRGRYHGDPESRDRAYHQGTVWPWLFGFYVEACLRARGRRVAEKRRLAGLLESFAEQTERHGLLHVSEVYDGDPPHRAGGCIAQAWSAAELLRAWALLDPR